MIEEMDLIYFNLRSVGYRDAMDELGKNINDALKGLSRHSVFQIMPIRAVSYPLGAGEIDQLERDGIHWVTEVWFEVQST